MNIPGMRTMYHKNDWNSVKKTEMSQNCQKTAEKDKNHYFVSFKKTEDSHAWNIQGVRGSKMFLADQWLVLAVLCDDIISIMDKISQKCLNIHTTVLDF